MLFGMLGVDMTSIAIDDDDCVYDIGVVEGGRVCTNFTMIV